MTRHLGTALAIPLAVLASGAASAGAAAAPSAPATPLALIVQRYQTCMTDLSAQDQAILQLRFGTATHPAVSAAAAAAQTHQTVLAFTTAEIQAVRRLEGAHRAGKCPTPAPAKAPASHAVKAFHVASTPPATATTTSSGLSWTSPTELVLIAIIVLALGALFYGLRRDFGRPHAADWGPGEGRRWPWRRRRRT